MAVAESCRRTLEIEVPQEVVKKRADEITAQLRRHARLPGFRPGKAPLSLVRQRYREDIRAELLRDLVPEYLSQKTREQNWDLVGDPSVSDIELTDDSPLKFKATLEVMPEFALKDYSEIELDSEDTSVSDQEVEDTLRRLQEQEASYDNVDESRPLQDGDFASIALQEISPGQATPAKTHELLCEIGAERTVKEFTESLRGASLGDERQVSVSYPPDYSDSRLAGKTLNYHVKVLGIKKKQLPELNDDFAKELGQFESIDVVRQHVREDLGKAKEREAEQKAKAQLREKLSELHDFPVPEALVEHQIERRMETFRRELAARGMGTNVDWGRLRSAQRQDAVVDVKSGLILRKIADENSIEVEQEELDKEIRSMAAVVQQPVEALQARLTSEGGLDRIKTRLRIDKALVFALQQVAWK
ncbi:MAG: trigger factor [Acidobacteria bacterium]|nr:trigger factor [Acidobacteriota bacterium]